MNPRRPTSVAELTEAISGAITGESVGRAQAFALRESDVVISPYGKCGTTFLQQTVHGLRTRGDMSFREISMVVPWLETAYDLGLDLDAPQPHPRAYKSHMSWSEVPKGGRYIVSLRDPIDRFVSIYRFFENWWFEPGSISFNDFTLEFSLQFGSSNYWQHLLSWWETRNEKNVLLLCYEDMTADVPETVRTVAAFCEIATDPEVQRIVEEQSSREFMSAHRRNFDDYLMRKRSEEILGIPAGSDSHKIRPKVSGERETLVTEDVVRVLDQIWHEEITSTIGFATYGELRSALNRERSTSSARAHSANPSAP